MTSLINAKRFLYEEENWGCSSFSFSYRLSLEPYLFEFFIYRPVKHADIQIVERKLMQTMDMIVVKKKRIALMERDSRSQKNRSIKEASTSGVWSMLKSVASVRATSSESMN